MPKKKNRDPHCKKCTDSSSTEDSTEVKSQKIARSPRTRRKHVSDTILVRAKSPAARSPSRSPCCTPTKNIARSPCNNRRVEDSKKKKKKCKVKRKAGEKKEDEAKKDEQVKFLNEVRSVESELPLEKCEKKIITEGEILEYKGRKFRFGESADGDFGTVKATEDREQGAKTYTIMYETHEAKCKRLKRQASVMVFMASEGKTQHMFRVDAFGAMSSYQFLVYDEYGPTLWETMIRNGGAFGDTQALKLAMDTLEAIEDLHTVGYIHRDIKPHCFAYGAKPESTNTIYLINACLGKKYCDGFERVYKARTPVLFFGTIRYVARTALREEERGRRDDIESWFYMISEFYGEQNLPWRRMTNKTEVLKEKEAFMTEDGIRELRKKCPEIPLNFTKIVAHINQLKYEEKPNYDLLRDALRPNTDSNTSQ